MKNIFMLVIAAIAINVVFAKDGVLNVNSGKLLPSPSQTIEESNTGVFTFDIYESEKIDVKPVNGAPALITISLSNIDMVDGINSVHGYESYFDIATGNVSGVPNIYLQQKATIPGGTIIPISINVRIETDISFKNIDKGAKVNLTPGAGQKVVVDFKKVSKFDEQVDNYQSSKKRLKKDL